MEEFILNLEASAPPFKDQLIVWFSKESPGVAANLNIDVLFSSVEIELVEEPAPPEGPVIIGFEVFF